jgi:hypothetical protein
VLTAHSGDRTIQEWLANNWVSVLSGAMDISASTVKKTSRPSMLNI